MTPRATVIFTTYNQPAWLQKTLWGFVSQRFREFEIIVADDGSGEETRKIIEEIAKETEIPIRHLWQEDKGFRKCRILNKAIVASQSDYLIFTDGDCIPHPDFVQNHLALAGENLFVSGGYFKLPLELSRAITRENIVDGDATRPAWLATHGAGFNPRLLKLWNHRIFSPFADSLTTTRATWNGHSASTWKRHIVEVNGYDERMQWGGLDRELGERLENLGIRGRQARYRCCCVHLEHGRGYKTREAVAFNQALRAETRSTGRTVTPAGIAQLGEAGASD